MRDMPNLDFARSLAVLSVVVEHTLLALGIVQVGPFPVAWMGVLGVLVFFVLTSLVLMWSFERKPHTLDFYIRRIFRIYPLALVAIGLCVLFHAPVAGSVNHFFQYNSPHLRDIVIQSMLLQNLLFSDKPIMSAMWSLPYEVQMYVLLPVLFFFVRRNFVLWPLLVIWCLIVLNARSVPAQSHTFLSSTGYFLPGVMAYVAFGRWKPRLPAWALPIFLLVLWVVFLPHANFHSAWLFCLLFALGLPFFRQFSARFITVPSAYVARYSYGIYLMHPLAIVIGIDLLHRFSLPVRLLGELVPLCVLPVVLYHTLENPMIKLGARLARRAERRYEQHVLGDFRAATTASH